MATFLNKLGFQSTQIGVSGSSIRYYYQGLMIDNTVMIDDDDDDD